MFNLWKFHGLGDFIKSQLQARCYKMDQQFYKSILGQQKLAYKNLLITARFTLYIPALKDGFFYREIHSSNG